MKIAILNVKYSPNLGDGAIAECLECQLKKRIPDLHIFSLDIGGMDAFGSGGSIVGAKLGLMKKINRLPEFMRKAIKSYVLPIAVSRKYAKEWRTALKDCDALIIGGGQLFMDVDHYFPYRISLAVQQSQKNIPVFVYAVGVSTLWTQRGVRMFHNAFRHGRLIQAAVRDKQSHDNWKRHFSAYEPLVTRDPALLAAESYEQVCKNMRPSATRPIIAFGVSDPEDLKKHADSASEVVFGDVTTYLETLELLCKEQFNVVLFTNGADHIFLDQLGEAVKTLDTEIQNHVTLLPRPLRPVELIEQITRADVVVAHRLHANILAYSYGIPHVGLGWDGKLKSFFESVDRMEYIVMSNHNGPASVVEKVKKTLHDGIDTATHANVLGEARTSIDQLAGQIMQTVNH